MKKFSLEDLKNEIQPKKKKPEISEEERINKIKEATKILGEKGLIPPNKAIAEATIRFLAESKLGIREKGLFFIGGVGTGKTVALKIINSFRNYDFIESHQLTEDSKGRKCSSSFIKETFLKYMTEDNKNIIIDDLGDELTINNYGIKSEFMAEVIRERNKTFISRGDLTLISSNLGYDDLKSRYGQRIISRIEQMCEVVVCNGDDLRVKK